MFFLVSIKEATCVMDGIAAFRYISSKCPFSGISFKQDNLAELSTIFIEPARGK